MFFASDEQTVFWLVYITSTCLALSTESFRSAKMNFLLTSASGRGTRVSLPTL